MTRVADVSFGRSKLMTGDTPSKSMPRAAMWVALGSDAAPRAPVSTSAPMFARLFAGGRWIRTFGSPRDPLPLREQSAAFHDGLTVSRPGTEISNPSPPSSSESTANPTSSGADDPECFGLQGHGAARPPASAMSDAGDPVGARSPAVVGSEAGPQRLGKTGVCERKGG